VKTKKVASNEISGFYFHSDMGKVLILSALYTQNNKIALKLINTVHFGNLNQM
jgi:hypothetical protein